MYPVFSRRTPFPHFSQGRASRLTTPSAVVVHLRVIGTSTFSPNGLEFLEGGIDPLVAMTPGPSTLIRVDSGNPLRNYCIQNRRMSCGSGGWAVGYREFRIIAATANLHRISGRTTVAFHVF